MDSAYHKGMTVMKLALSVGKITSAAGGVEANLPTECYFDDNLFFEVHDDDDAPDAENIQQEQTVVVKDHVGKTHQYRRYSTVGLGGGLPYGGTASLNGSTRTMTSDVSYNRRPSYMDVNYPTIRE